MRCNIRNAIPTVPLARATAIRGSARQTTVATRTMSTPAVLSTTTTGATVTCAPRFLNIKSVAWVHFIRVFGFKNSSPERAFAFRFRRRCKGGDGIAINLRIREDASMDEKYILLYDELYRTYRKRVKTKHLTTEAYDFERKAGSLISEAAVKLVDKKWDVNGYFTFVVYHPRRIINAPFIIDRVVEQWYVEKYIIPVFKNELESLNLACREGKGPFLAMDTVKYAMYEMYCNYGTSWAVWQYDGEGYFDNISHDYAKRVVGNRIDSEWAWVYHTIVDSYCCEDSYAALADPEHQFGFPKGNLPSQWTGIIILNELDWMLSQNPNCDFSERYMDDGISFYPDIKQARCAAEMTKQWFSASGVGVRLHSSKSNYFPITRGFTYCGWHYSMDKDGTIHVRIKNSKKKEQERRLRKICEGVKKGKISIKAARRAQEGVFEYLSHGSESQNLINYMYRTYPIP